MQRLFILFLVIIILSACSGVSKTKKGAAAGALLSVRWWALLREAISAKQEDREETHKRQEAALRDEVYRVEAETRIRQREAFVSSFKAVILFDYNY